MDDMNIFTEEFRSVWREETKQENICELNLIICWLFRNTIDIELPSSNLSFHERHTSESSDMAQWARVLHLGLSCAYSLAKSRVKQWLEAVSRTSLEFSQMMSQAVSGRATSKHLSTSPSLKFLGWQVMWAKMMKQLSTSAPFSLLTGLAIPRISDFYLDTLYDYFWPSL